MQNCNKEYKSLPAVELPAVLFVYEKKICIYLTTKTAGQAVKYTATIFTVLGWQPKSSTIIKNCVVFIFVNCLYWIYIM